MPSLADKYIPVVPEEEKQIMSLINRMGVIRLDQIKILLNIQPSQDEAFVYYLKDLFTKKEAFMLDDREAYIPDRHGKKPDNGVVECLWDVAKQTGHIVLDSLDRAQRPEDLFYDKIDIVREKDEDGNLVNKEVHRVYVDTYINKSNKHIVPIIQERFYARTSVDKDGNPDGNRVLNLVVTDMSLAEFILDTYALDPATVFTFIDHEHLIEGDRPSVKYFKAS